MSKPKRNLGDKIGGLSRHTLYLMLFVATSIPLFFRVEVPNKPDEQTIDLYVKLMQLPQDRPVLVQSDWTNSTRGESAGQLEALIRILMRRNIKFVLYSGADPQAPQVARNVMTRMNEERAAAGLPRYEKWNDWLDLGYFPNLEGFANALAIDVKRAFGGRKAQVPGGGEQDVFRSPVLANVNKIGDVSLLVNIHASGTIDILIERLFRKVPLASMCTGVMGPQAMPYYQSSPRQIEGLSVGLKGVYDLETMMEYGVHGSRVPHRPGEKKVVSRNFPEVDFEGFKGMKNYDRAGSYYPTLHVALTLMILAVVAGNVGMVLSRRGGGK